MLHSLHYTGACEADTDTNVANFSNQTTYKTSYCSNVPPAVGSYTDMSIFGPIYQGFLGAPPSSVTPNPALLYAAADDDDDVCFTGESTVELKTGHTRSLSNVEIGDKILTMTKSGKLEYSDVVAVPHQGKKSSMENFYTLSTKGEVTLEATAEHLVAVVDAGKRTCDELDIADFIGTHKLMSIKKMETGMCIAVARGDKMTVLTVSQIEASSRSTSLLSVVTNNRGYPVISGVVASSFALNDSIPHFFYDVHRILYKLGLHSITKSKPWHDMSMLLGRIAVKVHRAVM